MIRSNSQQKTNKVMMPQGQSLSPFNSAIRLSSHQIDAPSTPQRPIIGQNPLKVIMNNADIRGSNSFTPNSKVTTQFRNQENKPQFGGQDQKLQQLINDNHYLTQLLEQARNELRQNQLYMQDSQQLDVIRKRMEKLEGVIDQQQIEIEQWKKRYQQVCTQDQAEPMQQMEQQILMVIQENERLNLLIQNIQEAIDAKDQLIAQLQQQNVSYESEIKKLKEKIKVQDKNLQIQREEIVQWHETFTEFEKSNKNSVSQESELMKSKLKIQELEFQLHKRRISEVGPQKQTQKKDDSNELELKLRQLLEENGKLNQLGQKLQEENNKLKMLNKSQKTQNQQNQLDQIKQELVGQSLFSQEEFKKIRQLQLDKQILQEQLNISNEQVKQLQRALSLIQQDQNEPSEQLFDEFLQSQNICIQLIDSLL